jgi:hypothetical protein
MMNNEDFNKCFDESQSELDIDMYNYSIDLFRLIKQKKTAYFQGKRPIESLHLAYELLLYFMACEDYEKCAVLRRLIDDFAQTFSLSKLSNKLLESSNY